MGHEAAGTVFSISDAVKSLEVGDRVAIEPGLYVSCSFSVAFSAPVKFPHAVSEVWCSPMYLSTWDILRKSSEKG